MMKFARAEGIEGEIVLYKGVAWVVKGLVHPENGLIAYPRYLIIGRPRKLRIDEAMRFTREHTRFWDYLSIHVPIIPRTPLVFNPSVELKEFIETLRSFLAPEFRVIPTGSAAVGIEDFNDLDAVIVCQGVSCQNVLETIHHLIDIGILRKGSGSALLDWLEKHSRSIDFYEYSRLKSESPLIGYFKGRPYTLRIVNTEFAPNKVLSYRYVEGVATIVKCVSSHTTPCRYVAIMKGLGKIYIESYRLLFTFLPIGTQISATFRVELREDGLLYAIPDHSKYIRFSSE